MDLTTSYLGLKLESPLMPGASPMVEDLDTVRRLEDAGASAIVMRSLFEEEINRELGVHDGIAEHGDSFAESLSYLPRPTTHDIGPEKYLEMLRRIKEAVCVPVIASLNGLTAGGWTNYARKIQQAGADALELNIYYLATNVREKGDDVEQRCLQAVRAVKGNVSIPVAVKISPFYSSLAHLAREIDMTGADGLVLFNRFYQPDIDVEELEIVPNLRLSSPDELRLRIRWLAILSGQIDASLACSGGVHTAIGAIKALMAGADAVQMVSALLAKGPAHLTAVRDAMALWMEEHEYLSVAQLKGCMSLKNCPDPKAVERANYIQVLESWRP